MTFKNHLSGLNLVHRASLAQECKTTLGHLQNVAYGYRTPSPILSLAIERATNGAVTRRDLRPDDWHLIWPELATEAEKVSHG